MFYGFLWGFTGFYWVSLVTGRDIWPRCCSFSFIGRGGWSWRVERFLFYFFHFFSVKFSLENFFASCCFFGRRRNVPTPFLFFFSFFSFCFYFWKGGHTRSSFFFFGLFGTFFWVHSFCPTPVPVAKIFDRLPLISLSSVFSLISKQKKDPNISRCWDSLAFGLRWPISNSNIQFYSNLLFVGKFFDPFAFFCCVPFFPVPSQRPIDEYFCFLFFFVLKEKKRWRHCR